MDKTGSEGDRIAAQIRPVVERLRRVHESEQGIVTLTLDVAGSAFIPEETRVFIKDLSLESLPAPADLLRRRAALRELTSKLREFVLSDIPPGAQGLYLAGGPDLWEVVALRVRLPNFVHLGDAPYLPPLLAALEEAPRCFVIRSEERTARLLQVELGVWSDLDRWEAPEPDPDPEHFLRGRRPGYGVGGPRRDLFARHLESETSRMLARAARRIGALQARTPASHLFFFGHGERYGDFRSHLPPRTAERTEFLGAPPATEDTLRHKVEQALAHRAVHRLQAEVLEFQDRREQGHLVALGPAEVLESRTRGRLARVFLDAEDPVPGARCLSCGMLRNDSSDALCETCGGMTIPTSLCQAIVAHALAHPPLPLTFVTHPSGWLAELGGMAGLLSQKGISAKR